MKKWMSLFMALIMLLGITAVVSAEPDEEYTQLYISVTVEQYDDGSFDVTLIDDRGGPVTGWPVILEIDGEEVKSINTDSYGTAYFEYDIPSDAQSASITAYSGPYDVYYFNGVTEYLTLDTPSDTPEPDPDETPEPQPSENNDETVMTATPEETVQTTTTVSDATTASTLLVSPLTTAVKADRVVIGVDVDAGVLTASQLSKTTLTEKATMQMSKALYTSLVTTESATIHLEMLLNETAGAQQNLLAAKNAGAMFASYDDATVVGFAVDTGLVYVDGESRVPLEVADGEYTIAFPVPESMKYSEKIAVAVCTADGLSSLQEVIPSDGVLNFTVQRFQTLAIVGFGRDTVNGVGVQMPWYLLALIIGGVVLVIGGVLLLIFVGLRRRKTSVADELFEENKDAFATEDTTSTLLFRESGVPAETVVLDLDEQTELTEEEYETFREKGEAAPSETEHLADAEVFPAAQIDSARVQRIREEAAQESLSADDLLNEVMSDLENLDAE